MYILVTLEPVIKPEKSHLVSDKGFLWFRVEFFVPKNPVSIYDIDSVLLQDQAPRTLAAGQNSPTLRKAVSRLDQSESSSVRLDQSQSALPRQLTNSTNQKQSWVHKRSSSHKVTYPGHIRTRQHIWQILKIFHSYDQELSIIKTNNNELFL